MPPHDAPADLDRDAPATTAQRRRSALAWSLCVAVVGCALFAASAIMRSEWTIDDAFIYQRFVRNAAAGNGLVYSPEARAEGISSPLWALSLIALAKVGFTGFVPARVLGFVCGAGVVVTASLVSIPSRVRGLHAVAVAMVALQPSLAWWSVSGMDSALFALFATALFVFVWNDSPRGALAFGGLIALARPEGAIFTTATALWYFARVRTPTVKSAAWALAILAAPWLCWEVYRVWKFHPLLANSAEAKLVTDTILTSPTPASRSWTYLLDSLRVYPGEWLAFVVGLACMRTDPGAKAERSVGLFAASCALGVIAFVVKVRGDWMPHVRFFLPLSSVFAFTGLRGAVRGRKRFATLSSTALVVGFVITAARQCAEFSGWKTPFIATDRPAWPPRPGALFSPPRADTWAHEYAKFALRYTLPGESIVHLDVGESGYLLTDLSVMDQFGLVSRTECEFLRGRLSVEALRAYFQQRNSSVAFVLVARATRLPATKVMAPLSDELERGYVSVARLGWWGPHDLLVMVRRDALDRQPDPSRLARLLVASPGLTWDTARLVTW